MLEGAQQFAATFEDEWAVAAREFHFDDRLVEIVLGRGRVDEDLVAEMEVSGGNDSVQQFADLFCGGNLVGDWHSRMSVPPTSRPCGRVFPSRRAFPCRVRCGSSRTAVRWR